MKFLTAIFTLSIVSAVFFTSDCQAALTQHVFDFGHFAAFERRLFARFATAGHARPRERWLVDDVLGRRRDVRGRQRVMIDEQLSGRHRQRAAA